MISFALIWWLVTWLSFGWLMNLIWRENTLALFIWSIGFMGMAGIGLFLLRPANEYQCLTAFLIFLWGLRLCLYRFILVRHKKSYAHLFSTEKKAPSFFCHPLVTAFRMILVAFPLFAVFIQNIKPVLGIWFFLSLVVWSIGFMLEAYADYKLLAYKTRHPWGLYKESVWGWCRHPNYLGEILVWFGFWGLGANVSSFEYAVLSFFCSPMLTLMWFVNVRSHELAEGMSTRFGAAEYFQKVGRFIPNRLQVKEALSKKIFWRKVLVKKSIH